MKKIPVSYIEHLVPDSSESVALRKVLVEFEVDSFVGKAYQAVALAEQIGREESILSRLGSKVNGLLTHRSDTGVVDVDLSGVLGASRKGLPDTPTDFSDSDSHTLLPIDVVRCMLIGAAEGYSYSYSGQAKGNLCDDVMPRPTHEHVIGVSSGIEVGWHTEDAPFNRGDDNLTHSAFDIISFAYLRNPANDPTRVTMPVLSELRPEVLSALRKYQFELKANFTQAEDYGINAPTSLVYGAHDWIRFTFARLHEQLDDYRARGLMDIIKAFIEQLEVQSQLVYGIPDHIAFVDNMRVAHARGKWRSKPRFDGRDRWQRRLGAVANSRREFLESFMDEPVRRVINSKRTANYLKTVQPITRTPVV